MICLKKSRVLCIKILTKSKHGIYLTYGLFGCYYLFMLKKLFAVALLFISISVLSGMADITSQNKSGVIYLYMPNCKAFVQFSGNYSALERKYKNKYSFQKINVMLPKGQEYMNKYGLNAVPCLIVINGKTNKTGIMDYNCMFNMSCLEKEFINFIN